MDLQNLINLSKPFSIENFYVSIWKIQQQHVKTCLTTVTECDFLAEKDDVRKYPLNPKSVRKTGFSATSKTVTKVTCPKILV